MKSISMKHTDKPDLNPDFQRGNRKYRRGMEDEIKEIIEKTHLYEKKKRIKYKKNI